MLPAGCFGETTHKPVPAMTMPRRDILTIHVNDYFQCGAADTVVSRRHWGRFEKRVEANTLLVLDLLDRYECKATFFASGWIGDQVPELFKEIVSRGHEVASTGYHQYPVNKLSPDELRAEAVRSRIALERACGMEVVGYRCAGWLQANDVWALEMLAQEGFRYDSSLYPFGFAAGDAQFEQPHSHHFGDCQIWEIPIPSARVAGFRFPISGSTYLRQLPRGFMRHKVEAWHKKSPGPWLLYFQVSEIDPGQPRITALSSARGLQKYRNVGEMQDRVRYFLERYQFCSAATYLEQPIKPFVERSDPFREEKQSVVAIATADRRPITIVVPCFNEQETLSYLANALRDFDANQSDLFDISYVFVDDCSSDKTHERLVEMFGSDENCSIVRQETNRGVAAATLAGIRAARTETVCVIDCDCSYDPAFLAKMVPELSEGVALVTASPYHSLGSVINVPGWRLYLSKGLSFLYQRVLRTKLATYTACVRVYRRSAMADLKIAEGHFLGIAEILARLDERGETIVEVPAVLESRVLGHSKMKITKTIMGHLGLLAQLMRRRGKQSVQDPSAQSGGA